MLTVTITLCSWCGSPRPVRVDGAENLPPGTHQANLQISHGMCPICEIKWMSEIEKGGVTHSGTLKDDNATEGKRRSSKSTGKEEGGV